MAYYDALVAKWATLGAPAVVQTRIAAAVAAFAVAPPGIPTANPGESVASFEARLDAANAARDAWRETWIGIFVDPAVVAKCEQLNAVMIPGAPVPDVPIAAVMEYLRTNGLWLPIKAAVATSQGAGAAVDLNDDLRAQTINFSLPAVTAMAADLVSHGLLTNAQVAAMAALGTPSLPWWQSAGYPGPITSADLEAVFAATQAQTVLV
jgi:hypothetical protein